MRLKIFYERALTKSRGWLFFWTIAGVSPLLFFEAALFENRASITLDAYNQFYPVWELISRSFREGRVLLWLPNLLSGYPIIGDPQAQLFYLPNLPFFLSGSFSPLRIYCQLVFHVSLAGGGACLLARHFMLSRTASALSALSYMYCGFMLGHLSHPQMLYTAAWMPLVFLAFARLMDCPVSRRLAVAAFTLACAYFCGHPPTSFYLSLALVLFGCWNIAAGGKSPASILKQSFYFVAAITLALLLYSVQLLPSLSFWRMTERSDPLPLSQALAGGVWHIEELIALIDPNFFNVVSGSYWGSYEETQHFIYMGIGAVFLIPFGVYRALSAPRSVAMFFFLLFIAGLGVCMGDGTPLYPWLFERVPLFNLFRAPAYSAFVFFFCGALSAGFGWDALVELCRRRRPGRILGTALAGVAAVVLLSLLSPSGLPLSDLPWIAQIDASKASAAVQHQPEFPGLVLKSVAAFTFISLLYFLPERAARLGILIVSLVFADFFLAGSRAKAVGFGVPHHVRAAPLPDEKYLEAESKAGFARGEPFRVWVEGWLMHGNVPVRSGIHLLNGFNPLTSAKYAQMERELFTRDPERYFQLNNVRFVKEGMGLREIKDFLPRAYSTKCEEEPAGTGEGTPLSPSCGITPLKAFYGPNRILIRGEAAISGRLVLLEAYNDGWRARADGTKRYSIRETGAGFMSVNLAEPAGELEFSFRSRPLYLGIFATGCGAVLCLLLFFLPVYAKGRRE